jgi:hypothetical protein
VTHVRSFPHEVEGHLQYGEFDLSPYWALSKVLHQGFHGYSGEVDAEYEGEVWHLKLTYSKSGIAPRPEDSVNAPHLYEYELHAEGPRRKHAHFNVSPRFEGMTHFESGESLDIPWELGGEGVDVTFHGANLEPEEYPRLLSHFARVMGKEAGEFVRADYFESPHPEYSNVFTYERYVRVAREVSKKVVRSTGPLNRIRELLATQEGTQGAYHWDNEDVVGKMHRLQLSPTDAGKLVPTHQYGKQLKYYHPKYVRSEESEDDSLYNPKVGVLVKKKFHGEAIPWEDLGDARREIEETLVNLLAWSNVPTKPDPTTYVEDDHFTPVESDQEVARFEDPTPEIEARQDALLVTTLRELSGSAPEVVESLATDGGQHYTELAENTETSVSTIYRALQQLGNLARNEDGNVDLASEKLRQEIVGIVERTDDHLRSAADRACKLVNLETRQAADSALQQWMSKYGAQFVEATRDDERRLRIDTVLSRLRSLSAPMLSEVLQEGLEAWCVAGRDPKDFTDLRYEVELTTEGRTTGKVTTALR